jgi:hypothetical protein
MGKSERQDPENDMGEIKAISSLQADSISGWGGSITFLQKYVS